MMKCIGVLLKEPLPGKVKTRLVADGLDQAFVLQLYHAFLADTLRLAQFVSTDWKWAFIAPGASARFEAEVEQKGFTVFVQQGADLGERISHLFQTAFAKGATQVVVVGSDSPSLPPSLVEQAFEALNRSELVLGPAQDGGYYLIGMSSFFPEVFQQITWSSEWVLQQSLDQLEKMGKLEKAHLLPMWYDIDQKKDLQLLTSHLKMMSQSRPPFFPSSTWQILDSLRAGIG